MQGKSNEKLGENNKIEAPVLWLQCHPPFVLGAKYRKTKKVGLGDMSKMGLVIMKISEPSYFNFFKS